MTLRRVTFGVLLPLLGACACTCACSRASTTSAREEGGSASPAAKASTATRPGVVPAGAAPSTLSYVPVDPPAWELMLRQNREVLELRDPLRLALAHVPEPHPGWGKLPEKLAGTFPGSPRFTVRGYAYRYQGDLGLDVPGCIADRESYKDGDGPLAQDGSLCPSVGWPGAVLTDAQAMRIATVVRSGDKGGERMPTRCAFDPHHAFVFFGDKGTPVAALLVCFKCNQWRTFPAQPGLDFTLSVQARNILSAVCREAGLGACGYDEATTNRITDERIRWQAFKEAHDDFDLGAIDAWGPREPFLEAPSGVDPDRTVADAGSSEADRRRLCAWYLRRRSALDAPRDARATCSSGAIAERKDFAQCLATFPTRCAAPLWRAEACVRTSTDDPCAASPVAAGACEAMDGCNWGIRRTTAR